MGLQDFSLGFTTFGIADYVEGTGNYGPSYSVGTLGLISFDSYGPSFSVSTTDLAIAENYGPSYSILATGLTITGIPGFVGNRIIHYNDNSNLQGPLILADDIDVMPVENTNWEIFGWKPAVLDHSQSTVLTYSDSNSFNINTSPTGDLVLTLPSAARSGVMYTFARTSANNLLVAASGFNQIVLPTGAASIIELTAIGDKITLISTGASSWLSL